MVVITLTDCPAALRGVLTKWLLEINPGVFVGRVNARVRENIWALVKKFAKNGRATMVFNASNEQRLDFRVHNSEWEPIDFDGIKLILHPSPARVKKLSALRLGYSKASKRRLAKQAANRANSRPPAKYPSSYAVIDIETTGLSPEKNEIIEIGAVKIVEHEVIDTFEVLVASNSVIPPNIERLTGITGQLIEKEGLEPVMALKSFIEFIGVYPLVAHNMSFDMGFLNAACAKHGVGLIANELIDTLELSKKYVLGVKNYSLKNLAEKFQIETNTSHRSLADCLTIHMLYEKLIKIV
ncbi:DNA polymerase III PolC-type [Sporotomaculum syntrophicum]|uniref:DNA polymerase III PolC-type n=1 Tax=Sporotomaculum syntrophicum TaxID=182264 RepID=A0A9D2WRE8_9FIRM|nr:type I-E CRISPR-associated endoribonuclease Cas2e [Sporotomaculum syntrophicum]KAF1085546.1 DNA polymerase III PolC-type [Sporotomaculum syntrophicum]